MSALDLAALILLWQAVQMTVLLPWARSVWRFTLEQSDHALYRAGLVYLVLALAAAVVALAT
ncbi:MAG: hypothetical protein ACREU2_09965 [Steroidobacteraceae bacterium]